MKALRRLVSIFGLLALLLAGMVLPAVAQEMDHLHVNVDIKPGDYPNVINLKSKGLVPVALLGSADFDVLTADTGTVAFGRMHEGGAAPVKFSFEDVNLDGYLDIVFKFVTQETGLQPTDTEACLHGMLLTGEMFCGHDSVIVIR